MQSCYFLAESFQDAMDKVKYVCVLLLCVCVCVVVCVMGVSPPFPTFHYLLYNHPTCTSALLTFDCSNNLILFVFTSDTCACDTCLHLIVQEL